MRALFIALLVASCAVSETSTQQGETCTNCFPGDDGGDMVVLTTSTPEHVDYVLDGVSYGGLWDAPCTHWPDGPLHCEKRVDLGEGRYWLLYCRWNQPPGPEVECFATLH